MSASVTPRYRAEVNSLEAYCEAVTRALVRHFGNRMPDVIIEPGRSMVGDAGVIQSEVVLVSRKAANDRKRWGYLDIGKFSGLAETMGESIKYRLRTARDGTRVGPRMLIAGPYLESLNNIQRMRRDPPESRVEPFERARIPIGSPEDARRVIDSLSTLEIDHFKVRTVQDSATYLALARAAHAHGKRLVGHVVVNSPALFLEA